MSRILIVDDELSIVDVLKSLLAREGHTVETATDGATALKKLRENVFDLLITDIRLPEVDGITLLRQARELQSHLAVIVITAYAKVDNAVEAMKNGAFDYVTKPFKFDEILLTVQRALTYEQTLAENEVLKSSLDADLHFGCLVGDSEPMRRVYKLIEKVARTESTILITGQSGTGKELVAKAIHSASARFEGPFVPINCAAMPETLLESELFGYRKGAFTGANSNRKGLFESANEGTIFLDEIGSIPLGMQMTLLRVLQEKEIRMVGGTEDIKVNVRVIAATNEDLEQKIQEKTFREDLFYRLSVIPIELPPLSERLSDIPALTAHFLQQFNKENSREVEISSSAIRALRQYNWPGNVRELENVINSAATLCDGNIVDFDNLPVKIIGESTRPDQTVRKPVAAPSTSPVELKRYMRSVEATYIKSVVDSCGGDKEKAAEKLGVSIATLYRKMNNSNSY